MPSVGPALRFVRPLVIAAVVVTLVPAASAQPSRVQSQAPGEPGTSEFVEGELLVAFDADAGPSERRNVRRRHDLEHLEDLPAEGLERVRFGGQDNAPARAAAVGRERAVRYAQPNHLWTADSHGDGLTPPDDPDFSELWGLHNTGQTGGTHGADIDYLRAREVTAGLEQLAVGVIDTGVAIDHPDLAANVWLNTGELPLPRRADGSACRGYDCDGDEVTSYLDYVDDPRIDSGCHVDGAVRPSSLLCAFADGDDADGNGFVDDVLGWDFVNGDNDPDDDNGHGSHVAGTSAAVTDNGVGIAGVSQARIMPLKFLSSSGGGSTADAIKAIDYALEMRAAATNNSWGGGSDDQALSDKILEAHDRGQVFVTSAGNDGNDIDQSGNETYPASYNHPNMITVAATNDTDGLAWFSNYGSESVHLGAPGTSIYSTVPGGYDHLNGTSMAAPHVTGAAAEVEAGYPGVGHLAVKDRVVSGGDAVSSLDGKTVSGKRLNLAGSLDTAGSPALTGLSVAPDPFFLGEDPHATVEWSQNEPASIVVRVLDDGGSAVRTEELGIRSADTHSWAWDGADDAGAEVTPGDYTIEVEATDVAGNTATDSVGLSVADSGEADLRATVDDSPDPVAAGDELTYDTRVRNRGPSTARDVRSRGELPPEVSDVSLSGGAAGDCVYRADNHAVFCEFGAVAADEVRRVKITGVVDSATADGTTLRFTYEAVSPTPDPEPDGRHTTATTTVTN